MGGMKAVAIRWAEQEAVRKARKRPVRLVRRRSSRAGRMAVEADCSGENRRGISSSKGSNPFPSLLIRHVRSGQTAHGRVAERMKAAVLKTADVKASVGSNPTPSARLKSEESLFRGMDSQRCPCPASGARA